MASVDVIVRLADRDSAPALTTLHRAAAHTGFAHIFPSDATPPTYEEDLARWELWLGPDWDQGRRAYVAAASGRLVGVVLAGPDPDEPEVGHVARLYVDPSSWGRGVGTLLYGTALRDLIGRSFPEATLWALEANHRARSWYERLAGGSATSGRRHMLRPASTTSNTGSLFPM